MKRSVTPPQALLILDMISEFDFPGWQGALSAARRVAPAIARLKARCARAGMPIVYVNDMAGKWQSDQSGYLRRCAAAPARGHDVARGLAPTDIDFFIFKPKHSGFYATPLAELLTGRRWKSSC